MRIAVCSRRTNGLADARYDSCATTIAIFERLAAASQLGSSVPGRGRVSLLGPRLVPAPEGSSSLRSGAQGAARAAGRRLRRDCSDVWTPRGRGTPRAGAGARRSSSNFALVRRRVVAGSSSFVILVSRVAGNGGTAVVGRRWARAPPTSFEAWRGAEAVVAKRGPACASAEPLPRASRGATARAPLRGRAEGPGPARAAGHPAHSRRPSRQRSFVALLHRPRSTRLPAAADRSGITGADAPSFSWSTRRRRDGRGAPHPFTMIASYGPSNRAIRGPRRRLAQVHVEAGPRWPAANRGPATREGSGGGHGARPAKTSWRQYRSGGTGGGVVPRAGFADFLEGTAMAGQTESDRPSGANWYGCGHHLAPPVGRWVERGGRRRPARACRPASDKRLAGARAGMAGQHASGCGCPRPLAPRSVDCAAVDAGRGGGEGRRKRKRERGESGGPRPAVHASSRRRINGVVLVVSSTQGPSSLGLIVELDPRMSQPS